MIGDRPDNTGTCVFQRHLEQCVMRVVPMMDVGIKAPITVLSAESSG